MFFSNGTESGDINFAIFINGHLSELLDERDHGDKRERRTGREDLPHIFEESHIIDLLEAGEEEGQLEAGRGMDKLDGGERVRSKGGNQGRVSGSQVSLNEIVRERHCERDKNGAESLFG